MNRRHFMKLSSILGGSITISTQLTGCSLTTQPDDEAFIPAVDFSHGVASGDPTTDAIILWTRAVPKGSQTSAKVRWQLSGTPDFKAPLRAGMVNSTSQNDYTLKVDVRGLPAGETYYYRFFTDENTTSTGITRTISEGVVDKVKFGVFSCSNYPAGYFNPYAAAARDAEIDVVLHLGDYIYEYPDGGYATENAKELGRDFLPSNEGELLTLRDYRLRYATYRQDKGLLSLHQKKPFIVVWDDHEIANDTYESGAQNHTPDEGDFFARRTAAIQAYYEWLPIRPPMGDTSPQIYRHFEFGNLVSLYMLDTRVIGRQKQIETKAFMQADGSFDAEGFYSAVNDPSRTLLGNEQFSWLRQQVNQSDNRWHLLGQQVLMGKMHYPVEIFTSKRSDVPKAIEALVAIKKKQLAGIELSTTEHQRLLTTIPYNMDAWDGYAAEREKVVSLFTDANKSLVVIAGDTHNGWSNAITNKNGETVAVEYATPSVSSPGMEAYLGFSDTQADPLAAALPLLVEDMKYCNLHQRGYITLEFTLGEVNTEWHYVSNISDENFEVLTRHTESYIG